MTGKSVIRSHFVNIDDYGMIKEIKRGGFGIVYLVENIKKNTKYLQTKLVY